MKSRKIKIIRVFLQLIFLLLFWYLLLKTTYPLKTAIPVNIFLRSDPLIGIVISITSLSLSIIFLPVVFVLLASIFLGRWYCGWVCPLGTHLDIIANISNFFRKIFKKKNKIFNFKAKNLKFTTIKYYLLLSFIILAFLKIQFIWLADPIVLISRGVISAFYFFSHSTRSSIPMDYYDPYYSHIIMFLILSCILIAAFISVRFWCRYFCPLGAFLGTIAQISFVRRQVDEKKCIGCLKCETSCPTGAIYISGKGTFYSECIGCMNCLKVCPTEAISFSWLLASSNQIIPSFLKNTNKKNNIELNKSSANANAGVNGISRKGFIYSLLFSIIGGGLFRSLPKLTAIQSDRILRPPGALPEEIFLEKCIRCGKCIKVCITKGLQPTLLETGLIGIFSPRLIPQIGYCEYNCKLCLEVCPTGAIQNLSLSEKQHYKIGVAKIDITKCIPYTQSANCLVCEENCPVPDKAIKYNTVKAMSHNQEELTLMQPYVLPEKCIGCGLCESKCPAENGPAITVRRTNC